MYVYSIIYCSIVKCIYSKISYTVVLGWLRIDLHLMIQYHIFLNSENLLYCHTVILLIYIEKVIRPTIHLQESLFVCYILEYRLTVMLCIVYNEQKLISSTLCYNIWNAVLPASIYNIMKFINYWKSFDDNFTIQTV